MVGGGSCALVGPLATFRNIVANGLLFDFASFARVFVGGFFHGRNYK
jgi:hypothetical protein